MKNFKTSKVFKVGLKYSRHNYIFSGNSRSYIVIETVDTNSEIISVEKKPLANGGLL